ncbi:MAG: integration host factor subunit beta [Nitrospirae bacterium]|nr:integration host factor subunit beta [Nitrospirota bacterium]
MTRSMLIEKVSEKAGGLTIKQTEIVIDTVFESIKSALQRGEKVEIRGFGNFRLKEMKPRKARNPKTGETVEVPQKKAIRFKVGKVLKEAMNPGQIAE